MLVMSWVEGRCRVTTAIGAADAKTLEDRQLGSISEGAMSSSNMQRPQDDSDEEDLDGIELTV